MTQGSTHQTYQSHQSQSNFVVLLFLVFIIPFFVWHTVVQWPVILTSDIVLLTSTKPSRHYRVDVVDSTKGVTSWPLFPSKSVGLAPTLRRTLRSEEIQLPQAREEGLVTASRPTRALYCRSKNKQNPCRPCYDRTNMHAWPLL